MKTIYHCLGLIVLTSLMFRGHSAETNSTRVTGGISQVISNPPLSSITAFGTLTTNSICVVIHALSSKPGPYYYFLPKGSTIRDAAEAAEKTQIIKDWDPKYSSIKRPNADGSARVIRLPEPLKSAERIVLRHGDNIRFGHEVY